MYIHALDGKSGQAEMATDQVPFMPYHPDPTVRPYVKVSLVNPKLAYSLSSYHIQTKYLGQQYQIASIVCCVQGACLRILSVLPSGCQFTAPRCWIPQGALYVTDNAAYTWQAAVQETVDATLNRTVSSGAVL